MLKIVIKHEISRIKNGFAATALGMNLTAHGYSPEVAKLNLERGILLYFRPFERDGTLASELAGRSAVQAEDDGEELVVLAE